MKKFLLIPLFVVGVCLVNVGYAATGDADTNNKKEEAAVTAEKTSIQTESEEAALLPAKSDTKDSVSSKVSSDKNSANENEDLSLVADQKDAQEKSSETK